MKKQEIKKEIKIFLKIAKKNESEIASINVLSPVTETCDISMLSQETIQNNVNLYTKEKALNIFLDNGPFHAKYTNNGSNILIYNALGYFSSYNTHHLSVSFERNMEDRIYDAAWLHNELYFAAAQQNTLYVYNNKGIELHAVRDVVSPRILEFLPYHFLLASACGNGRLSYLDTSTGRIVADINTKERAPQCLRSNPENGVICMGTPSGSVTMWAPNQKEYLVRLNCHRGGVSALEIERSGNRMVTCGIDNKLRVFDLRNTYSPLKTVRLRKTISCSSLSQTNLLALGGGRSVVVLRNFEEVYMKESPGPAVSSVGFCPFQDIIAVGHEYGISSMVVPGSGDQNYDTNENTPFINVKQRQEMEVKKLLEKIPFDMINLENVIGAVRTIEDEQ